MQVFPTAVSPNNKSLKSTYSSLFIYIILKNYFRILFKKSKENINI